MESTTKTNDGKPLNIAEEPGTIFDRRLTHFAFNCLGRETEIKLKEQGMTRGRFFCLNFEHGGLMLKDPAGEDGKNGIRVINGREFTYAIVRDVSPPVLPSKTKPSQKAQFKTDTEISGAMKKKKDERDFVKWEDAEVVTGSDLFELSAEGRKWDQFEANNAKFGIQLTFKEEEYHRVIDIAKVDPKVLKEAEAIEKELMSSKSENRHIAEERGQKQGMDYEDEEGHYSAVIRTSEPTQKQKGDAVIKRSDIGKKDPQREEKKKNEVVRSLEPPARQTQAAKTVAAPIQPVVEQPSSHDATRPTATVKETTANSGTNTQTSQAAPTTTVASEPAVAVEKKPEKPKELNDFTKDSKFAVKYTGDPKMEVSFEQYVLRDSMAKWKEKRAPPQPPAQPHTQTQSAAPPAQPKAKKFNIGNRAPDAFIPINNALPPGPPMFHAPEMVSQQPFFYTQPPNMSVVYPTPSIYQQYQGVMPMMPMNQGGYNAPDQHTDYGRQPEDLG